MPLQSLGSGKALEPSEIDETCGKLHAEPTLFIVWGSFICVSVCTYTYLNPSKLFLRVGKNYLCTSTWRDASGSKWRKNWRIVYGEYYELLKLDIDKTICAEFINSFITDPSFLPLFFLWIARHDRHARRKKPANFIVNIRVEEGALEFVFRPAVLSKVERWAK